MNETSQSLSAADQQLSAKEQAMWLMQQYAPEHGAVNVPFAVRFTRPVRWWPLQMALNHLARRHSALRTRYPEVDGSPVKVVLDKGDSGADVPLEAIGTTVERLADDLRAFGARPFDLTREQPIRAAHFIAEGHDDVVCIALHHIASDAYSLGVLQRELLAAYAGLSRDAAVPDDLAADVVAPPRPPARADSLDYWRSQLRDVVPGAGGLSVGRSGQRKPDLPGERLAVLLSAEARQAALELAGRLAVTPNILMFAAYAALLAKHGSGRTVVVGVPLQDRGHRPHDAVGLHISIVPMRLDVDPDASFTELVRAARKVFLAGLVNAGVSVEESFPGSYGQSPTSAQPLFRHMFNFVGDLVDWLPRQDPDAVAVSHPVFAGYSRVELDAQIRVADDTIGINVIYAADVFEPDEIRAIVDRLDVLLRACGRDPDVPVRELPWWSEADLAAVGAGVLPTAAAADLTAGAERRQAWAPVVARVVDPSVGSLPPGVRGEVWWQELPAGQSRADLPSASELPAAQDWKRSGRPGAWRPDGALELPDQTAPATHTETPDEVPASPDSAADEELVNQLLALWREVLRRDDLEADDGFFAHGGTSLLAARLVSRIGKVLGRKVTLRTVIRSSSPRQLALRLTAPADGR